MLRAGICDLGTCDLEMGGVAGPADRDAGWPVRPAQGRLPPAGRERGIRLGRACRAAAGARSAVVAWLAARSARRAADLQRYRPVGGDMPHLRPAVRRVSAGEVPCVSARIAAAFPPRPRGVSAPAAAAFPPRGPAGVLPGMPRRFRAGMPLRFRPGVPRVSGWAAPALPRVPGRLSRPCRAPASSRSCDQCPGRAARDGVDPVDTSAGGQPLTSGPARVRLIRRMTRRSRSIAAR
jgi:hypothetical protein